MRISNQQYAQALLELVTNCPQKEAQQNLQAFVNYVATRHDQYRWSKILTEFKRLYLKQTGLLEVEIISATKLSAKTIRQLSDYVLGLAQAPESAVKTSLDEQLLGGVIIKYGDQIFDASLRTRLSRLQEKITS